MSETAFRNEVINNGNRTEWSPIRFVIIQVLDKIRFVNQEYDYRQNWTPLSPITNLS